MGPTYSMLRSGAMLVILACCLQQPAFGQFSSIINAPPDAVPSSLGSGEQLNLGVGGIVPSNYNAFGGSQLNVNGGAVGNNLEVFTGGSLNLNAGVIGDAMDASNIVLRINGGTMGDFADLSNVNLLVSGGTVGRLMEARRGNVSISGGIIERGFDAISTTLSISGGRIGNDFHHSNGARVTLSGGIYGGGFRSSVTAFGEGFTIRGGDFRVDGAAVPGTTNVGSLVQINFNRDSTLSGTFEDGTPFAFSAADLQGSDGDILPDVIKLQRTALPLASPVSIHVSSLSPLTRVRDGQTLTVSTGGELGDDFNSGWGSHILVEDGLIGWNYEAVGTQLDMSGGQIGFGFDAFEGTVVNLTGGLIGSCAAAHGGRFEIDGGEIAGSFNTYAGSVVNLRSGILGSVIQAWEGSVFNVSGGLIGDFFRIGDGAEANLSGGVLEDEIRALDGSKVTIEATSFFLDGVPIGSLPLGMPTLLTARDQILTGTYADGTPFEFGLNSTSAGGGTSAGLDDIFTPNAELRLVRLATTQPSDFNDDGIVNGTDFLLWQRGQSPDPLSSTDLSDWQTNYGNGVPFSASVAVPEPSTLVMFALALPTARLRRRG